jgi:hypothetical protein
LSALLLIDIPWFLTEGKLAAIFIKTFSWGFPTGRLFYFINSAPSSFLALLPGIEEEEAPTSNTSSPVNLAPSNNNQVFWRRCRGRSGRPLQGEFFAHTSFTLF